MTKSGRAWSGFTIVELVIVISIIAVLSTVSYISLVRVQKDGTDKKRAVAVASIASSLEKYYETNGEYPSCSAITASGATVAANTLPGIDKTILVSPGAAASETNSIRCGQTLSAVTGDDFYEYQGDGTSGCTGSTACSKYKIVYRQDVNSALTSLSSRR